RDDSMKVFRERLSPMRVHHFVSLAVLAAVILGGTPTPAAGPSETQRQVSAALWGTGPMGPFMPGANSSTTAIGPSAGIQTEFQRHISTMLWGTGPAGPYLPSSGVTNTTGTTISKSGTTMGANLTVGAGSVTLKNTNTYTGATTINA